MRKAEDISGTVLFTETIALPRWIIVLLISSAAFVVLLTLALGITLKDDAKESMLALVIVVPLQLVIIYFYRRMKLEKVVTSNGLYYKWLALHKKYRVIEKPDIETVQVKKPPFMQYGLGWRFGYGSYHSVNDKDGIQLFLSNGKKVFFGTGNITHFASALEQLLSPTRKQN
jgi:hypothetical protein